MKNSAVPLSSRPAGPAPRRSRCAGGSAHAAFTTALALAVTAQGTGQEPTGVRTDPPEADAPSTQPTMAESGSILEREVYSYPSRGRRDPFLPLDPPSIQEPGAGRIRLLGIIHHPDPRYRVAVMRLQLAGGNPGDGEKTPAVSPASRLRIGEVFAGMRIAAIEIDHVVVEVEEPGGTATRVLSMTREPRGSGS